MVGVLFTVVLLFPIAIGAPLKSTYDPYNNRWTSCELSWKFSDSSRLFKTEEDFKAARRSIAMALQLWEKDAGLVKFREVVGDDELPDIDIRFALRDHNCTEAFDGPGGVVAHSAYPPHGILHLDAEELWSLDGTGLDVSYVTLHEMGHVLGLSHSDNRRAIMHAMYRETPGRFDLSGEDIRRVRRLFSHCKPAPGSEASSRGHR